MSRCRSIRAGEGAGDVGFRGCPVDGLRQAPSLTRAQIAADRYGRPLKPRHVVQVVEQRSTPVEQDSSQARRHDWRIVALVSRNRQSTSANRQSTMRPSEAAMQKVTIGNVEIMPLLDTPVLMNPQTFLPGHGDQFLAEFGHLADERGLMPMAISCYLVRSGGKTILVDTGLGNRKRPGFPRGHLDESLRAADIDPASIEIVLNTHMHIDHVGWNTIDREDGTREIFFPKARF